MFKRWVYKQGKHIRKKLRINWIYKKALELLKLQDLNEELQMAAGSYKGRKGNLPDHAGGISNSTAGRETVGSSGGMSSGKGKSTPPKAPTNKKTNKKMADTIDVSTSC